MKKSLILLGLLLGLLWLTYYLVYQHDAPENHLAQADRGFAIRSMDDVDKMVIKHTKLQPLIFEKKSHTWILNGKYKVDPAVFVNIERVLIGIKMLYIPPAKATLNIQKSIKNSGIQVDLYKNGDQPFKMFFIGSDTQQGDGTYMILAGTAQPYVMHLPGLAGGIRSRFEQPLNNYRDKYLYTSKINEIDYVKVEYPKQTTSSFIISNNGGTFDLNPIINAPDREKTVVDQNRLKSYLAGYEQLGAEALINQHPLKDTVISKIPNCIITLRTKEGQLSVNKYYAYDDFETQKGNSRSPSEVRNQNRLFVWSNDEDFYTVQNRVFGKIFLGYQDFLYGGSQ
ncbi:MAG: hypothetical protein WAU01_04710 [Saprospiraceae bacterium]